MAADAAAVAARRPTAATGTARATVSSAAITTAAIATGIPTATTITTTTTGRAATTITTTTVFRRSELALLRARRVHVRLVCPARSGLHHLWLLRRPVPSVSRGL